MSTKMNRFQTLPDSEEYKMSFPGGFSRTRKDPIIAEAINYIGLSFNDDDFIRMLYRTQIETRYRPIPEDRDTPIRTSIGIDYEDGDMTIVLDTFDSQINILLHHAAYPFGITNRSYNNDGTYTMAQILSIRAALYTADHWGEFLNPTLCDTECVLSVLKDDLAEGIEKYLRYYITQYAKLYLSEILDLCNNNQWNELTAAILRICHEDGIQIPSAKINL